MESGMYKEMAALEGSHWWFQGRRAVVLDLLARYAPKGRLLDIGLGTGFNAKLFKDHGYVVEGVEPAAEGIAFAKTIVPDLQVIQASFPSPAVFSDTYDVVALLDVVEHFPDDMAALKDVARVLKAGGVAVITVPAFRFLWTPHDERAHHFRRYRKGELKRVLEKAGLEPIVLSYYNFFLFPLIALARIFGSFKKESGKSDFDKTPLFLNSILAALFGSERFLLRVLSLPFGVSIVALVRKK
ncbi:MAG: class I SAM-dependent methyltransferase [Minisyncoccia bacterium]